MSLLLVGIIIFNFSSRRLDSSGSKQDLDSYEYGIECSGSIRGGDNKFIDYLSD